MDNILYVNIKILLFYLNVSLYSSCFLEVSYDKTIKNVPWHILAPSAVACGMFLFRASAHPAERFFVS